MDIELQNVSFAYQTEKRVQPALADISLHIRSQEFVAIVGPSGCGKSTLLNLIGGFLQPTSGKILADGRSVLGPSADRIMIFQKSGLFPFLTVAENVEFGLKVSGVSSAERRVRGFRALDSIHLSEFANSYPKELSEGMKKIVEVARALVLSAPVLLFDEPLSSIDALKRFQMQQSIQKMYERNQPTIIWITHDLEEAVMLADRIVILSHRPGRVQFVINIALARPRTEEMRTSSDVQSLRNDLLIALAKERGLCEDAQ